MNSLLIPLVVAALLFPNGVAHAAPSAPAKSAASATESSAFAKIAAETDLQVPNAAANGEMSAGIAKGELDDYASHVKWQRQFARDSWDWHLYSTKLLLYVVMSIVAFGLLITYFQFTRDGRKVKRRLPRVPPAGDGGAATEDQQSSASLAREVLTPSSMKIGPAGLEVTSQVIGLLVLGFSLAFFYLYVKIVYPMQEVELQKQAQSAAAPATDADGKAPR